MCWSLKGRSNDILLQHAGAELDRESLQVRRALGALFGKLKS